MQEHCDSLSIIAARAGEVECLLQVWAGLVQLARVNQQLSTLVANTRLSFNAARRLVDGFRFLEGRESGGHVLLPPVEDADAQVSERVLRIVIRGLHVSVNRFESLSILFVSAPQINISMCIIRRASDQLSVGFDGTDEIV